MTLARRIEAEIQQAIEGQVFPGCVIGFINDGERSVFSFGRLTYDTNAERATEATVYDLASVTKSIPLASLALTFIKENKIGLTDMVKEYVPELQNDHGATVEDLLRYRVRGVRLSTLPYKTFEEIRTHVFEQGFDGPPGESIYTNLPAYVLGVVVERVGGASLAALAHRYFFRPLSMHHTTFFPAASDCAPTEVDERGEVRGLPHDESAYVFAHARRTVGHAGLFSTVSDILAFLEALLAGEHPHIVGGAQKGLGWQVNDARFMGRYASAATFGKTGFTGTSILFDMERRVGLVVLSNRTYPKRPPNDEAIYSFRAAIADLLFGPR